MEKTGRSFWNAFWEGIRLPQRVDYKFRNDAVIADRIKAHIPKGGGKRTMLEIGCAPGKWLIFFYEELSYCVKGYEYVEAAAKKTIENLTMNHVPRDLFEVTIADFRRINDTKKYDVVLSLGFVEHFNDFERILEKQLTMVKENGHLIVGVPNFRGISGIFQYIIDPHLKNKILPNHNLKAMDRKQYLKFAKSHGLAVLFSNYIGGFEPALFNFDAIPNQLVKKSLKSVAFSLSTRFPRIFDNSIISGYLLSIFKKHT